jgi:hypothetical protein
MNPPESSPSQPKPIPARVVVPNTTRREAILAVLAGIGILGFVGYGVFVMTGMQNKATTNTLTGTIVAKHFTPAPEDQISFSRKTGIKQEHIAGEYQLDVKVEGRTFEVPVDGNTYEAVRIGGSFTFIRPRSEQVK